MGCQNRRRIRIILILTGVAMIVIGIITGRSIVGNIRTKVDEQNCVTSKDDETYENWAKSTTFHTSVYFWHIKNKQGFLYNGETPQLEERGPYVYKTTSEKIDIVFDEQARVSYKTFTRQEFDAEATKEKCSGCKENDNITVLNLAYLGLMHQFKGDSEFSMFMIPHIVQGYITQLDLTTGSRQASMSYLGIVPNASNPQLAYPVFGQWLRSSPFGTLLVDSRRGGHSYNASEMTGLYNVLVNASLVLPPLTFNASTANYTARGNGLLSYLGYYVQVKTSAQNQTNPIKATMELQAEQVRQRIDELLCPDSSSCFKVNDIETAQALLLFITTHIPKCVIATLNSWNYGILVTRPQKELALGYVMDKLKLPPTFPNGIPVVGSLTNHANISNARAKAKKQSMYTCSTENVELANTWAAYDDKTEVPSNFYPNAPSSQSKISGGYDKIFSTVPQLSPCSDRYPTPKSQYELFLAPMYHHLRISYEKPVVLHGVGMHRFLLDEHNFKQNNYSVFTDGIIDLRNVRGFPVSSSPAGFLYGDPKLCQQLGMNKPTFEKYGSFVDIEPITGKPMNLKFRFQVNSVITKNVISSPRLVPLNITFYDMDDTATLSKYFPIFWTEDGGTLTEADANRLNDQLMSLIRVACSVIMVLPIIGSLVLLVGIVLVILAYKQKNQDSNAVNSVDDN